MNANQSSSTARTETSRHARFELRWSGVLLVAAAALLASLQTEAQEEVAAVWKVREVDFVYRSSTVLYPCHELQNAVAVILIAVGARDDIKVRASGCEQFLISSDRFHGDVSVNPGDPYERDRFERGEPLDPRDRFEDPTDRLRNRSSGREQTAVVRAQLMTPVEVTPAVLEEAKRDKSRRELISRVTGNPAAAMNDPVVFAAKRQSVTLSRSTIRLEPKHCELLEQMTRTVFRELDVRVVRGSASCGRNQVAQIAPQITVESLMLSGPMSGHLPLQAPAGAQGKPDPSASAPAETEPAEPATETTPK